MSAVNTHFTLTNADGGYLCEGKDIKGGYFVIDALENISARITERGSLCFVTGSENNPINKFYQYDGESWVEAKLGGLDSHGLLSFTQSDPLSGTTVNLLYDSIKPTQYDEMYSRYHWAKPTYGSGLLTTEGFPITKGQTYAVHVPPDVPNEFGGSDTVLAIRPDYVIVTDVSELYATVADNPYGWRHTDVTFSSLGNGNTSGYAYGTLTFVAPCTGYAFVEQEDTGALPEVDVVKLAPDTVVIAGNLQITGDINFGADSHFTFGTIEGTDFIADYAKVKNAPVEDDDVVNLKTLKEWVPSNTKTEKLHETTNVSLNGGNPQTMWGLNAEAAVAGTYIFELATTSGISLMKSHLDYSPAGITQDLGTIIDEWTITACTPPVVGSTSTYPVIVHEAATGDLAFTLDFCNCENYNGVSLERNMHFTIYRQTPTGGGSADVEGLPSGATEGAFLRYRNGAPVWEVIPSAEDSTF